MKDETPILVTGFEPFGGLAYNPSEAIAARIPASVRGVRVRRAVLPVDAMIAPAMVTQLLEDARPRMAIHLGLAMRRHQVSLEQQARNLLDFRVPDNVGNQPRKRPIDPGGPPHLSTTFPLDEALEILRAEGAAVSLSRDAGEYLCNQVYFQSLQRAGRPRLPDENAAQDASARRRRPVRPTLFIHVPADRRCMADARAKGQGELLPDHDAPDIDSLISIVERTIEVGLEIAEGS